MVFYVGSFTHGVMPGDPGEGISVVRLDENSGALERIQIVGDIFSPCYVAPHPSLPILYAVQLQIDDIRKDTGGISRFAIDRDSGTLSFLDRRSSEGAFGAHLSVHPAASHLFAANMRAGRLAAFPLAPDGRIGDPVAVIQHSGHGPHPRQTMPLTHSVFPAPGGRYVLCCDMGIDRVMIYRLQDGTLRPGDHPFAQVSSGAGARWLTFHQNGKWVYLANEIDATVSVFVWHADRGALQITQTVSPVPAGFSENPTCSELAVDPTGRFLYAAVRGAEQIARFAIDPSTGRLALIDHVASGGRNPMSLKVDPSGNFLLVANRLAGGVVSLRIDRQSGALVPTGHHVAINSPTCIAFG